MIVALIAVILIICGGAFVLASQTSEDTNTDNPTPTGQTTNADDTPASTTPSPETSASTITYTDDGFSPQTITVKAGTEVTINNTSSKNIQFDSDPHPVHTDDPELNIGIIQPGKSMTFTPDTKGTWGYHNHLNETETGTIVVQ